MNVVQIGGELYAEIAGQPRIEMLPEATDKFYIREIQNFVTFTRNEKGEIIEAAIQMGDRTIKAKKKDDSTTSQ